MSKAFALGALPTSDEAKASLTASREAPAPAKKASDAVDPLKPFNVRLPESLTKLLGKARYDDGITAVARIRALIELWRDDETLQQRVVEQVNATK